MAYAALLSLSQILDKRNVSGDYSDVFWKAREVLNSLPNDICTILAFLEDPSHHNQLKVNMFQSRIIDAAYEAGDVIESKLSDLFQEEDEPVEYTLFLGLFYFIFKSDEHEFLSGVILPTISKSQTRRLDEAMQELKLVSKELSLIMVPEENVSSSSPPPPCTEVPVSLSTTVTTNLVVNDKNTVVGFDDDFMVIKEQIFHRSYDFKIIPIVGMGGIGKSTLARKIYEDSIRMHHHFDRHGWIVVSQNYFFQEILLGLLRSMNISTDMIATKNGAELRTHVYKELFGIRYLIVVDDVWSTKVCDYLRMILPTENNGSRVLLTTRLSDVATYVGSPSSPPHELRFLNEAESWSLFRKKVFGNEPCPPSLVQVGEKVAKRCLGLPLTIVVAAGLLKDNKTAEYWESV